MHREIRGGGAFSGTQWFQLQWSASTEQHHITIKELIPIVIAVAIWGRSWSGKTVQAQCDKAAVVAIINSGNSKDREAMHLCRCLSFIMAKFNVNLFASHIRGSDNTLADHDALSRKNTDYFLANFPQAQLSPTRIPSELLDLLVVDKPDWRSPNWTRLWTSIFSMA